MRIKNLIMFFLFILLIDIILFSVLLLKNYSLTISKKTTLGIKNLKVESKHAIYNRFNINKNEVKFTKETINNTPFKFVYLKGRVNTKAQFHSKSNFY